MSHARPLSISTPRRRHLVAVFAAWLIILSAVVPTTASATAGDESSFIAKVNATRAGVGLPPLQPDVQLTNLARGWASSMRDGVCGEGSFICHASPISAGVTHNWAKLGENVGTGPDVGSVMDAFVASPGHYANIVDPEFTHIGVGVVWDGNRLFTTHRFMKLQNAQPASTTTTAPPTTTSPPTTAPATTATPTTTAPTTTAANTNATTATTAAPTTAAPSTTAAPDTALRERPATAQTADRLEERAVAVLNAIERIVHRG